MDKNQKRRYLLAIYLLIVATAVILLLIGFQPGADSWRSILFNISTELLAVAVVFFLVDFLFSIDDWDLSERIRALLTQLQQTKPVAENFFHKKPDVTENIQQANQIDLCGVTLTTTINRHFSLLRQRIYAGAHVRLLIMAPSVYNMRMAALRSEDEGNTTYYQRRLESTLDEIGYLYKNITEFQQQTDHAIGSFAARLLNYPPSFGMMSFDGEKQRGIAYVEIYPHHRGYGAPPQFTLSAEQDPGWHAYFLEQFEAMWHAAIPWAEGLEAEQVNLCRLVIERVRANDFFLPEHYLTKNIFADAQTIYLSGYSLSRTIREFSNVFNQKLTEGADIRVMVVDPESDAVLQRMALESVAATQENWRSTIQVTETLLTAIVNDPQCTGQIEIGYLPFTPSFGMIFINPDTDEGTGIVEIYHHKSTDYNAKFALSAAEDATWFQFFRQQYELLWESCRKKTLGAG